MKIPRTANAKEGDLIAFGHTHKPWHHEVAGIPFLNTGSVGKPKDGDWRVGYVLVEAEEEVQAVEFVRVEYDVERAAEGTLPDEFADQLRAEETNILWGPRSESKWKVS